MYCDRTHRHVMSVSSIGVLRIIKRRQDLCTFIQSKGADVNCREKMSMRNGAIVKKSRTRSVRNSSSVSALNDPRKAAIFFNDLICFMRDEFFRFAETAQVTTEHVPRKDICERGLDGNALWRTILWRATQVILSVSLVHSFIHSIIHS